jgi:predicted RNase H-like nuclease
MKFLGIDLGWKSQPSGLCCLELIDGQLQLIDLDRKEAIADILTWIDTWVQPEEPAIIAVDAPTLIPNATGSRLPDKLSHKYFGKYHAGCYPANQNLPFAERTINFGIELESRGFAHAPTIEPKKLGRYQIEVFPHPAIVHLFGLERILKYKKGRINERRSQLIKLYQYILEILPNLEPSLKFVQNPQNPLRYSPAPWLVSELVLSAVEVVEPLLPCGLNDNSFTEFVTGAALKAIEDKLDSIICAYVAAHWWYWGEQRNLVLGDRTTGYIVIPKKTGSGEWEEETGQGAERKGDGLQ